MGTWLLERGLTPKFARLGTNKEGCGGLTEQASLHPLVIAMMLTVRTDSFPGSRAGRHQKAVRSLCRNLQGIS